jgi:hypothetical protein
MRDVVYECKVVTRQDIIHRNVDGVTRDNDRNISLHDICSIVKWTRTCITTEDVRMSVTVWPHYLKPREKLHVISCCNKHACLKAVSIFRGPITVNLENRIHNDTFIFHLDDFRINVKNRGNNVKRTLSVSSKIHFCQDHLNLYVGK